jgi:hypothetical protein
MQHKLRKEDFVELVKEFLLDNELMNEFIDYSKYVKNIEPEQLPFEDYGGIDN